MLEVEKLNKQNLNTVDNKGLQEKCDLLIEGVKLAKKIGDLVKWITNLHADADRPMAMSVLLALCRLIEVLKGLYFVFHKNLLTLVYVSLLVCQHLTHKAVVLIQNLKVIVNKLFLIM